MILDVSNGHSIYSDGMVGNGIEFAALENGLLHLRFRRGFNASCSVLQASASCWGQLLREGKIPRALAQSPPPSQACALAYQTAKAPIDDPSIIFYDVDMTIDDVGRTTIISRGAVGCDAMP
jgi:hypothetical protein